MADMALEKCRLSPNYGLAYICIAKGISEWRFRRSVSGENPNRGSVPESLPGSIRLRQLSNPETTGSECSYLKLLVDSRKESDGGDERRRASDGICRYYDIDCFSIGITGERSPLLSPQREYPVHRR